jgi:hypothetical protein
MPVQHHRYQHLQTDRRHHRSRHQRRPATTSGSMDVGEDSDEADGETGQTEAPPVHTLPKESFAGHSDGDIDLTCLDETVKMLDPSHVKVMLARAQARMKDIVDVAACMCCDRQLLARGGARTHSTGMQTI